MHPMRDRKFLRAHQGPTFERWERMESTSSSAGLVRSSSPAQEAAQLLPDTGRSCPFTSPATAAASTCFNHKDNHSLVFGTLQSL